MKKVNKSEAILKRIERAFSRARGSGSRKSAHYPGDLKKMALLARAKGASCVDIARAAKVTTKTIHNWGQSGRVRPTELEVVSRRPALAVPAPVSQREKPQARLRIGHLVIELEAADLSFELVERLSGLGLQS